MDHGGRCLSAFNCSSPSSDLQLLLVFTRFDGAARGLSAAASTGPLPEARLRESRAASAAVTVDPRRWQPIGN
jgi:hypothetical protein